MNRLSEDLKGWFRSLRDTHACLNKRKSGDGEQRFTEREDWIVIKVSFLKSVIRHPL